MNATYCKLLDGYGIRASMGVMLEIAGTMRWLNAFLEASSTLGYLRFFNHRRAYKEKYTAYMRY